MSARAALVALAIALGVVLLALIAVVLMQPFAPRTAVEEQDVTAAPVTVQPFDDARSVAVEIERGASVPLRSPFSGTVTALDCSSPIVSGTAPLRVDGQGVLALHASTPWWRDLADGDRGTDVDALQHELGRLGHDVSADGAAFGPASRAALSAVLVSAGLSGDDPVASGALTRTIWLPAAETAVASCDTSLGTSLGEGDPLLTSAAPITSARITATGPALPRVVLVDDIVVPVGDDGTIAAEHLPTLAATPTAVTANTSDEPSFPATLRLAEPVDAAAVPASAIASDDGDTGCVVGDGAPLRVTLLGSQLGHTFVAFEGTPPSQVDLRAPELIACD